MQTDPLAAGDPPTADEAERMAAYLESTGSYRVLRRMQPRAPRATHAGPVKRAIFVDVETTGLDAVKDSIIELAILPFNYTTEGTIVAVGEPFSSLRDPGVPIPPRSAHSPASTTRWSPELKSIRMRWRLSSTKLR